MKYLIGIQNNNNLGVLLKEDAELIEDVVSPIYFKLSTQKQWNGTTYKHCYFYNGNSNYSIFLSKELLLDRLNYIKNVYDELSNLINNKP